MTDPVASVALDAPSVVRLAYLAARRSLDHEAALDVAQDTWIKFHAQAAREPGWPQARARAWIRAVAENAARSLRRKAAPQQDDAPDEREGHADDPADLAADAEETAARRDLARRLLADLPAEQRELVALRDIEGLAWDVIADVTGENPRTLRSRYTRLWQALRREAARREGEEPT